VASALPQHPPELASSVAGVGALPQQPLAAGGVNASVGSPMKPPGRVVVLMVVLLVVSADGQVLLLVDVGVRGVEPGLAAALRRAHLGARVAEPDAAEAGESTA
jgi:hypothetical protein